ncbi:MarR family transcriptional regulator [bacterium]|nr:MarR family transcriptional regulator [bacterium]MBU1983097.1 MarR family transcriptional regulator [bacterium]
MEKVDRVLVSLRQIIRALDSHSRQLSQDHGLTVPQLVLLKEIGRCGSVSVGDLAREVSLSQATVTSILDRLEQRQLMTRKRGESDKRLVYVQLTMQGKTVLAGAPPLLQEQFVESFENLKDWEQSLILSSLERVADMMGIMDEGAAPMLTIGSISPSDSPSPPRS